MHLGVHRLQHVCNYCSSVSDNTFYIVKLYMISITSPEELFQQETQRKHNTVFSET